MKRKMILSVAFALATIVGSYFSFTNGGQMVGLSEMQLANIEALSQDEMPSDNVRDQYCESMAGYICTIYWRVGSGAVNSTSYFDYWSR
jgi:hypothetical protein